LERLVFIAEGRVDRRNVRRRVILILKLKDDIIKDIKATDPKTKSEQKKMAQDRKKRR
jgi:hypothetical protein